MDTEEIYEQIIYNPDGSVKTKMWKTVSTDRYHNPNGPVIIEYNKDTIKMYWMINGCYYREDGPAYVCEDKANNILMELWIKDDMWHRIDGPAKSYRRSSDKKLRYKYYINGEYFSKTNWLKHPEVQIHNLNKLINKELL
jgi:hypothetical protein